MPEEKIQLKKVGKKDGHYQVNDRADDAGHFMGFSLALRRGLVNRCFEVTLDHPVQKERGSYNGNEFKQVQKGYGNGIVTEIIGKKCSVQTKRSYISGPRQENYPDEGRVANSL